MNFALDKVLEQYRDAAKTEREKGTYFEDLIQSFLSADPRYIAQYANVQTYAEWASLNDQPANDAGIDLVAELGDKLAISSLLKESYQSSCCE